MPTSSETLTSVAQAIPTGKGTMLRTRKALTFDSEHLELFRPLGVKERNRSAEGAMVRN